MINQLGKQVEELKRNANKQQHLWDKTK